MSELLKSAETLNAMFWPRACAVLGASDNPSKIGGIPVRYFKKFGYQGNFYPINPTRETVQGLPAIPSIEDVEEPVDMAIMAVPASLALETAEACARKGVKALVVLTAGFAEVGDDGVANQACLREIGQQAGMRIIGPNCLGYFNPRNSVYASFSTSFSHGMPRQGNVGMVSQSGAFGSHCFVLGREKGMGFSYWVTTGNEVDVDVAECIAFMAQDDETKVICAYLEGCKDGARLEEALGLAFDARKPVLIQKVGSSAVGTLAAASHTASLTGSDHVYDAVFERYNAYRCRTVDELIDITHVASKGVLPKGRKVAIGSMSGGAAVMMADAADDAGLELEPLSAEGQATLKHLLPYSAVRNPVDFTAQIYNDLSLITKNFDVILGEDKYDAVVGFFSFLGFSETLSQAIVERLQPIRAKYANELIILSITGPKEILEKFEAAGFPCITEPYRALEVVAALATIEQGFQKGLPSTDGLPDAPTLTAGTYSEMDAKAMLAEAGIPCTHKLLMYGVKQDAKIDRNMVEYMIAGGTELILGAQIDPIFGAVVMVGFGGVFAEVMGDVAFKRAPFGKQDALGMIDQLKGAAVLKGGFGSARADISALAEAIARLSVFAHKNADILETIDINPFLVLGDGAGAVALGASIATKKAPTIAPATN